MVISDVAHSLQAAVGVDEAVYVWHTQSGAVAAVLLLAAPIYCALSTSCLNCVTFTADGTAIASGGYDSKVTLWDLPEKLCSDGDAHANLITGRK